MSATFSFTRLGKLITKQFFENSKLYLYSVLALFGLLAIVFSFWISVGEPSYAEEETYIIFLVGLFITGTIFASMSFNMLGRKDKGIYWLGIPATHFEKLVCSILFSTVLFFIVYCFCFYIVKMIAVGYVSTLVDTKPGYSYREMTDFASSNFVQIFKNFIFGYFAVQALYLFGSVYFPRYSFILTTVVGAGLMFLFGYYMSQLDDIFSPDNWEMLSVRREIAESQGSYQLFSVSDTVKNILKYVVQFIWVPVFWLATWFRLKEKEI